MNFNDDIFYKTFTTTVFILKYLHECVSSMLRQAYKLIER
jgi:hypothetical protein